MQQTRDMSSTNGPITKTSPNQRSGIAYSSSTRSTTKSSTSSHRLDTYISSGKENSNPYSTSQRQTYRPSFTTQSGQIEFLAKMPAPKYANEPFSAWKQYMKDDGKPDQEFIKWKKQAVGEVELKKAEKKEHLQSGK